MNIDIKPDSSPEAKHIHEGFRGVLELSPQERVRFLYEPRWIGYARAKLILDDMAALLRMPKVARMRNMLIVGDSNNGKTKVIERFKELHGQGFVSEDSESIRPVIVVESPPSADEKGLYVSILSQFWSPYKKNGTVTELRYDAISRLRLCRAEILIVDEIHSLLVGPAAKLRMVMNTIKMLCNELRIPIVGVGTRDAVRVLHSDPQHASRFDVYALPLWKLDPEFQTLLAGFESVLPLKQPSHLASPEMATLLHDICEGNLGDLHRLLIECSKVAIETGKECITREIVTSKAWVKPTKGIREVQP
ncbi:MULTISPECIES: TniB family NTP-binding protein [Delftia]|uniref:TniB family NTP-binding protein n=1 Tax=Delftia acidovorans TaxID=80866 RepID=A0A7T2S0U9_DELAC|nr:MULTISPECIES: TniB family NTP-binding protein [Delftia]OBY86663.1 transposase [Delftia sp. JD2]QPS06904.1 TniB family NTP-binding protein [Delftia acidovorans]